MSLQPKELPHPFKLISKTIRNKVCKIPKFQKQSYNPQLPKLSKSQGIIKLMGLIQFSSIMKFPKSSAIH